MCPQVAELRTAFESSTDNICKIADTMQLILDFIVDTEEDGDTAWIGALRLIWENLLSEREAMAKICTSNFGARSAEKSDLYEASVTKLLLNCPFVWRA